MDTLLESNQADPSGVQPTAFGAWVSSPGDVNGDGFDDVIVGAPGWESLLIHEGAAFIFLGGVNGIQDSSIKPDSTGAISIQSGQGGIWEGITGIGPATLSNVSPIIDSFTAPPTSISAGGTSLLTWGTSNASSVTIDNGVNTVVVAADSSINVTPATTTTYTPTATGSNGSVAAAVNQSPIANAGPDHSATDGDGDTLHLFTLVGSGSSDPDGSIFSYEWSEAGIPVGSDLVASVMLGNRSHAITLLVRDNEGATASDTTLLTLTSNQPPVVIAGTDQVISDGDFNGTEPVTLSESGSFDPDGNIVTFDW